MSTKTRLINSLKKHLPAANILSEPEECYAYSKDASNTKEFSGIADVVVFVENIEQIQNIVKIANKNKTPIVCRGAGTNVVGACSCPAGGIVLNFSKMNKIININPQNMTVRVEAGVVVGDLRKEVEKYGLYYPPAPSNLVVSTIGGSIAQNSAGAESFKYGATKDYVLELTVVTAKGEILQTGSNTIKNSTGYNLTSLFASSEGTLGIVAEAVLKLIPKPENKQVIMAYYDSVQNAVTTVDEIISQKLQPVTLDFMDGNAIRTVEEFYSANLMTDKECALLIEVEGDSEVIERQRKLIVNILEQLGASGIQYSTNRDEYDKIWMARRSSMGACAKLKPNVTTDDVIVPRENLAQLVLGIQNICKKYNLTTCLVGHIGDGSIHPQIPIDYNNEIEYKNYKLAKSEIYALTKNLGGIISGEHGIGIEKRPYIKGFINSVALDYMRHIKKTFDPNNILNPYKIF